MVYRIVGALVGRPRYAIVGGGFAGVAAAWHLLALTSPRPVDVHLFDGAGLAGGASGAAAGLLHPFSPKGKLLWHGEEAMGAALELLAVANAHRERMLQQQSSEINPTESRHRAPDAHKDYADSEPPSTSHTDSGLPSGSSTCLEQAEEGGSGRETGVDCGAGKGQISWAQPFLRPAADARQAAAFLRLPAQIRGIPSSSFERTNTPEDDNSSSGRGDDAQIDVGMRGAESEVAQGASVRAVGVDAAAAALPGLPEEALRAAVGRDLESSAALWIEGSHVVHPERYLRALWGACEETARSRGGQCRLVGEKVASLHALEEVHGHYTAVIVAAGAAAGTLPEIGDKLPMELCQGYTLDLAPPRADTASVPVEASTPGGSAAVDGCSTYDGPSLLGSTYLAAQWRCHLVVGATKRYGLSSQQALEECGRAVSDPDEVTAAAAELVPRAAGAWPPAARWEMVGVRSGVRALPPRSAQGSLPLAGKLEAGRKWWVVAGLGARGLVYHAWLGRLIARAVLADDESELPGELRRWQP
ncbi:FAD dependent oxidoreductase [Coccomyxa subellipsoidea C-169]|uniref:FAD dependent oxidoreductase n=1 Tax=Coccomyxa subellipsoidea (strain C-169) TaxID=574566 RepID=I0YIP3_COCSC|nr:FAD dependent oxidoreductase [Coccomyxa subellipsoidea C-169]EIE18262.1 FAD dependent oxidoreductase [Coccomyxa subellipsoidea C-169]|eukprot:XP_005642806.1 FAD dependent oxidoreductase [Coccomyxa subellipsoidea C-169]